MLNAEKAATARAEQHLMKLAHKVSGRTQEQLAARVLYLRQQLAADPLADHEDVCRAILLTEMQMSGLDVVKLADRAIRRVEREKVGVPWHP
jgi:hypothetical protein